MRTFVKWQFHREIINDCIQTHGHGLYMPTCLKEAAGGAGLNGLNHHLPRRRWPNNALCQGGHGKHGAGICLRSWVMLKMFGYFSDKMEKNDNYSSTMERMGW